MMLHVNNLTRLTILISRAAQRNYMQSQCINIPKSMWTASLVTRPAWNDRCTVIRKTLPWDPDDEVIVWMVVFSMGTDVTAPDED
jgi:hypothetical protein